MLNYTATDQHGRPVVGTVDDQTCTRRELTLELYRLGHRCAAVYDGQALVGGVEVYPGGDRYWWASLKPECGQA